MGLWGVLLEIVRAVTPHAAPHVAKVVVDAARERMSSREKQQDCAAQEISELTSRLELLEERAMAADQRAAEAEERMVRLQAESARKWASVRLWLLALLAWNAALTGLVIYFALARK